MSYKVHRPTNVNMCIKGLELASPPFSFRKLKLRRKYLKYNRTFRIREPHLIKKWTEKDFKMQLRQTDVKTENIVQ